MALNVLLCSVGIVTTLAKEVPTPPAIVIVCVEELVTLKSTTTPTVALETAADKLVPVSKVKVAGVEPVS
jgi:hypothetical protein